MAKPLLMFTWTDVEDALDRLAETPRQRRAVCWLLERLKAASETLPSDALLAEIISSGLLLQGEPSEPSNELQSLFDD
jgi:hypothetical protein